MSRVDISETEWLAALESATKQTGAERGGGLTMGEIAEMGNMGTTKAKVTIRKLLAEGRVECRHERRPSIDGVMRRVPTYILKSAGAEGI